ncbi:F-box/WD repeat-containing protein 9 [Lingula anatina]|uniref:F-box/WD repeat-containing protein 9 n=1 Tax=Lingula anatina TaxID=7574 RepID=A0A1S3JHD5_LINAN|nr:F-box/WD repeat-containing protein 9 [Lingula anatina]XP_013409551.1 F-box/WD repeat-containing protein 9 [Lingula anatina]|eukprot:XP_013409550.1 F-box/WD repeat-containing protein 9 [Lingula anatina]
MSVTQDNTCTSVDMNKSTARAEPEGNQPISLDTLPPELFLCICDYLDAKFVIKTLSLVCKAFHSTISDDSTWKIRIGKRWPKRYPVIPVDDSNFNWKNACIQREEQHRLWSNWKENMDHFVFREGLYAPVDVVHLMKGSQLLASGSRDRYLNLLDLNKLDPDNPNSAKDVRIWNVMNAHKGWIWSMSSFDDTLLTGSWDTYLSLWDLAGGGVPKSRIKCKSAVLCIKTFDEQVTAGGYDNKVYTIDPRVGIMAEKRYHKKPVLCMAVDQDYVITGSEDQTIVVYDKRAGSVCKTISLEESYAMSMSYGLGQLWVGSKAGVVHLFDAREGRFELEETYDIGHSGKVTGVHHSLGSIMTCSTDRSIKILQPTRDPDTITTLDVHDLDVAGIDFQNNVLASASCDVSIGIWKEKVNT